MTTAALLAAAWTLIPHSTEHTVVTMRDYPIQPVPFTAVKIDDAFWKPRIETNRTVTIPYAFQQCEEHGRVKSFEYAAQQLQGQDPTGKPMPVYPFDDTDIYKTIEGASYSLNVHPDKKLEDYVDSLIAKIGAAQEPDGYLYTARTINPKHPHDWSGAERWVNEEEQSHELYNLGHLYEAAVAHHQATGKKTLLDIAVKTADLLVKTFGPGKRKIWPGHEIIETGLAKMYRETGKREYLELAQFMIECRGGKGEYWQAHKPVLEQDEAVGHAVRAAYLYAGVADVAALTGQPQYIETIDKIWHNAVEKKLYITGGIGATGGGEAFGANFDLPNQSAYAETCAAIANDYWNQRQFLLHGDAKYVDVFERTLYNGMLSGVGLEGKSFFYANPLATSGHYKRSPWFACSCCPTNVVRFIASVPGYVYGVRESDLFVNLYVGSTAEVNMPSGGTLKVKQETQYPWDGKVTLTVDPSAKKKYAVRLRIPGWARDEASPGGLYSFAEKASKAYTAKLNGKAIKATLKDGYLVVDRVWSKGDKVELDLPMPVRKVIARDEVQANRDRIAFQRGPIVYCAEGIDNPNREVRDLVVEKGAEFKTVSEPDTLKGIVALTGRADRVLRNEDGSIDRTPVTLKLVPYCTWDNRGMSPMAVWLPTTPEGALVLPKVKPVYSTAKVQVSGRPTRPDAVNDLKSVKRSRDEGDFMHWWPAKGTTETVTYTFDKPQTFKSSGVFWFDDTGVGECRVPASWKLLYQAADGTWQPVKTSSTYGVAFDTMNKVSFDPVTATKFRIEVTLQPRWSAGIQQWVLE